MHQSGNSLFALFPFSSSTCVIRGIQELCSTVEPRVLHTPLAEINCVKPLIEIEGALACKAVSAEQICTSTNQLVPALDTGCSDGTPRPSS